MPSETKETKVDPRLSKAIAALNDRSENSDQVDLSNLQTLGDENLARLASAVSTNPFLTALSLSNNEFSAKGIGSIATILCHKGLRRFELSGANLTGPDLSPLVRPFITARSLTSLRLSNNPLGNAGAECLAKMLVTNRDLAFLKISTCKIGRIGAAHIGYALQFNTSLVGLDLSCNEIGNEGAKHIAGAIQVNRSLIYITLSYNGIGKAAVPAFAEALTLNLNLTPLHLGVGNSAGLAYCTRLTGGFINRNRALVSQTFTAIHEHRPEKLVALVNQGAGVSARSESGWQIAEEGYTPLMVAARDNEEACVRALLAHSAPWSKSKLPLEADAKKFKDSDCTALEIAEQHKHYRVASLIWLHMRERWPGLRQKNIYLAGLFNILQSSLVADVCRLILQFITDEPGVEDQVKLGQVYAECLSAATAARLKSTELLSASAAPATQVLQQNSSVADHAQSLQIKQPFSKC